MALDLTHQQVSSQVEEIVRTHVGSATPISPDADLINDLAMDSLELVELGLKLEKHFAVRLPIAEIRQCVTLDDVSQLVIRSRQEQGVEK